MYGDSERVLLTTVSQFVPCFFLMWMRLSTSGTIITLPSWFGYKEYRLGHAPTQAALQYTQADTNSVTLQHRLPSSTHRLIHARSRYNTGCPPVHTCWYRLGHDTTQAALQHRQADTYSVTLQHWLPSSTGRLIQTRSHSNIGCPRV